MDGALPNDLNGTEFCAQNFRTLLDKNGQRWVPILDPPIHIKENYGAYDSGIASGVFVKDITGRPYAGQVRLQHL